MPKLVRVERIIKKLFRRPQLGPASQTKTRTLFCTILKFRMSCRLTRDGSPAGTDFSNRKTDPSVHSAVAGASTLPIQDRVSVLECHIALSRRSTR